MVELNHSMGFEKEITPPLFKENILKIIKCLSSIF